MQYSRPELKRINHIVSEFDQIYHSLSSHFDLSDSEFSILYTLCVEDMSCPLSDVTKLTGLPKQTINSALRNLERDGIIFLSSVNGRNKAINLTEKGLERCKESVLKIIEIENNILKSWGDEKVERYIEASKDYNDLMKEGIKNL